MPKTNVIKKSVKIPTVLIAGGAGFVGSHLAETILLQGARVIVLDDFSTGKKTYVDKLLANPSFALFNGDINQGVPSEIESVDYVVHLAALEEYLYNNDYLNLDLLLTNGIGTKNLLDFATKCNAKFMLVSSVDVYMGMMSQLDVASYFGKTQQDEKMYSLTEAKRYAEALVWEYFKKSKLDARIVRLPEIYGPGMDLSSCGVLGIYLQDLIQGKNLTIYGDGNEKSAYLYIQDAVSGIAKALFSPNTAGNIYSLYTDSVAELELAFLVKSVADRKVDVVFSPASDIKKPQRRITTDTYNLRDLGWSSKTSLKEGILETLSSFGYSPNEHAFKPAKYIEQKQEEKLGMVTSLVDSSSQNISVFSSDTDRLRSPLVLNLSQKPTAVSDVTSKHRFGHMPDFKAFFRFFRKSPVSNVSNQEIKSTKTYYLYSGLGVVFALSLVFLLLPITQTYFGVQRAASNLQNTEAQLKALDTVSALESSKAAYVQLSKSTKSFSKLRWLFVLVGKQDAYSSYSRLLSSATYFSRAVYSLSQGFAPATSVIETLKPTSQTTLDASVFNDSKLAIANARSYLQLAEADLLNVDISKLDTKVGQKVSEYSSKLSMLSATIDPLVTLSDQLPSLLGLNGDKKYLVLFMNNNELRPTGGFIGSYASLTLNKGKISQINIDDIYNPDGQLDILDIKTDQPKPVVDFLKEDTLHIRNANWHPDFVESSKVIADLYTKATGEKVDGVFAIDLYFVKYLLNITGPIYLTAYNEEVSADNFYERTQLHSDFNYKEGVSQKKSFLAVLGGKVLEQVFAMDKTHASAFTDLLQRSIAERHVMGYFFDGSLGNVFKEAKVDGSLVSFPKDYLYVVNANLGGTKSNYYVDQKMNYRIMSMTRDGLLRAELVLTYSHNGNDDSWPGGPYQDYVRVLTQSGSKLTGAKLSNKTLATEEDIYKSVLIDKVGDYTSFESSFTLKPKETVELTFMYDLPQTLSITTTNKNYELYWQKQPGTQDDNYNIVFDYPFGMTVEDIFPKIEHDSEVIKDAGVLNTDKYYRFHFK